MPFFQAENLRVELQPNGVAVLWLDVPGRSMNVFNRQVLADLDAALDRLAAEPSVQLLVIRSAKPAGFLAGADLHEFTKVARAEDATALSEAGQHLFDKVADLRAPTMAVIHGPCLGGGLEFSLACDYRLVVDLRSTQLGLPEIKLGLLPGWGGTQRLPRVVGLERALRMILPSRTLNAREAVRWGLADALAPDEQALSDELQRLAKRALIQGKRPKTNLSLRTWRQRLTESTRLGRAMLLGAARRLLRRLPDDMPAPHEALEAVRVGLAKGMPAGLIYEREATGRLAMTPACRHLVGLFFQREKARKLPEEVRRATKERIRRVGIVGAGTMGAGIAQLAALRGCDVIVQEVNDDALGAGILKIDALFQKAIEKRVVAPEESRRRRAAIKGTVSWDGFGDSDIVIEAVIEDLEAKRTLFRELEKHTRPDAVLATNTSSLSVRQLQEGLAHPERVAGLHFFNPVHKMELVEVAHTPLTDSRVTELLAHWAVVLGKTPVVVRDSPGFVVNRILMPYLNEAVLLVAEGMRIDAVDQVMRRFGMPMGPLELLDQVGLDVAAHIANAMQPTFGTRFAPNPAFERMRGNNWLGQKSGAGFYHHRGKQPRVNKEVAALLRESAPSAAGTLLATLPPAVQAQQARDRMVLGMVNEAAACLGEGLATDAETIDLAMILGTGWAPHRGGPLHYADTRGPADVVRALAELAGRLGPRFEPCPELRRHAEHNQPFCRPIAA
jgi:3-hydroxyacyl-CoA dehydrogenase/enoyl-CoA hydratase/3-hydroxybutyryl-CoA epimerase